MIFPLAVAINFSAPPSGKSGMISRVSFRYLQLPNAPTHTSPWLPHHAKTVQPPGFSGDGGVCAGKFLGWTMAKNTDSPMKFQEKESDFYLFFLRFLVCNNNGDLFLQYRNLMHNDIPEDLEVNAEISMNQGVAEPGNSFPVRCRELCLYVIAQVPDGFSDNLKIAYNRIGSHPIVF